MSDITIPMHLCLLCFNFCAKELGTYPNSILASSTFCLISSDTYPLPLIALEAVETDIPHALATSLIVIKPPPSFYTFVLLYKSLNKRYFLS